jgi:hypothetical protein
MLVGQEEHHIERGILDSVCIAWALKTGMQNKNALERQIVTYRAINHYFWNISSSSELVAECLSN